MKVSPSAAPTSVTLKTASNAPKLSCYKWWTATSGKARADQLVATANFLKESQNYRQNQAAIYAKMYGNQSLLGFVGQQGKQMDGSQGLPADRPTFNIIQSAVDTLVSRIGQSRPTPVFLTDNSDYKERNLAKKLNNFILGEFYQTKAYDKGVIMLRDALVEGSGVLKVFATADNKVGIDRVLLTELFVDPNEAIYGDPRSIYQIKLIDRSVLADAFPTYKSNVDKASQAYVDDSHNASKSVSDLVIVVEGWHLKSGKTAKDGRHTIACSAGVILDEQWDKDTFPFVFLHFSPRMLGFWAQGLAEQLMGTQMEINSLLFTISRAIKLVGVPRVFVEDGSKVVKSHFNNDIGSIVTFRGTKPIYEVAQCVPQELYAQLQRCIDYGFQQSGVSSMQATSQKPAGLDSGEAIRSYDDISNDRFATLSKRFDNAFIDLAYLVIDTAKDICEEEGKYKTVFPNKNGAKEIDLPKADMLKNPFVIQCFNTSSLPRDPAGRMQKVAEMIQSGMISIKEGRRLLDYPDLQQIENLANASEERIFQILDEIIEEGKFTPPDPFLDIELAMDFTKQYYNLYSGAKLEPERQQMLRDFWNQCKAIMDEAMTPPPGAMAPAPNAPQAAPMPTPQSDLIPNGAPAMAA